MPWRRMPAGGEEMGFAGGGKGARLPIEIIAGREEARLITPAPSIFAGGAQHKRLVVDIGGGSTEFIIGKRLETQLMESLFMAASATRSASPRRQDRSRKRGCATPTSPRRRKSRASPTTIGGTAGGEAVGSSGTRARSRICSNSQPSIPASPGDARGSAQRLQTMYQGRHGCRSGLAGLRADRMPVLPRRHRHHVGGVRGTGIERRRAYSDGALRLGVLYDPFGRFPSTTTCAMPPSTSSCAAIRSTCGRPSGSSADGPADPRTAIRQTGHAGAGKATSSFLGWAAKLHEIGISVAHNGYHKHGAYILTFADMPGFSRRTRARLALLVFGHRGKLKKITTPSRRRSELETGDAIRLAALFHCSRDEACRCRQSGCALADGFQLELQTDGWRNIRRPQPRSRTKVAAWQRVNQALRVKQRNLDGGGDMTAPASLRHRTRATAGRPSGCRETGR